MNRVEVEESESSRLAMSGVGQLEVLASQAVSVPRRALTTAIRVSGRLAAVGLYSYDQIDYRMGEERIIQSTLARSAGEQTDNTLVALGTPTLGAENEVDLMEESATLFAKRQLTDSPAIVGVAKLRVAPPQSAGMSKEAYGKANTEQHYALARYFQLFAQILTVKHGVQPIMIPETMILRADRAESSASPTACHLLGRTLVDFQERVRNRGLPPESPLVLAVVATIRHGVYRLDRVARRSRDNVWTKLIPSETAPSEAIEADEQVWSSRERRFTYFDSDRRRSERQLKYRGTERRRGDRRAGHPIKSRQTEPVGVS